MVSVINDLVTDNRVIRTCNALRESGYGVLLVGRRLRSSPPLPQWPFGAHRMRLIFTTGPLFYFFFQLRLFFFLLRKRTDLVFANDLDTLLPNYLVSRIKNIPLIYDSHELFCDVPELQGSPLKQAIWRALEKRLLPRVRHRITVNSQIASIFKARYGTEFSVVRNIGDHTKDFIARSRTELGLPSDKKIVILQGSGINVDRGAEELMEAISGVDGTLLLVIGGGDIWEKLEKKAAAESLLGKVRLMSRMPAAELRHYTANADLGVSIDKPGNLNYENSLPNKIFDYVQAGVPVLASRLPGPEEILTRTGTGVFIENHDPAHIAEVVREALREDRLAELKLKAQRAKHIYTWDEEKKVLMSVIGAAASGRA